MNGAEVLSAAIQAKGGPTPFVKKLSQEWPPLRAIPEVQEELPEPFPFDGLGPLMGRAARAIADAVQAPDALAGGSVLAAGAVAAQPHADVLMPHGQAAPLSLFVAGAAESGARKSAVDAVACAPIEEMRRKDARAHAAAVAEHRANKGKPDQAGAEPPKPRSITVSKATTEGLHHLLKNQSHIGLFSPEGAEVVGGHSMQAERRSASIAWMLKAWGGDTLDSMTRGDGLSVLVGRRTSMHVLMQPVILQALMADPLAQGQGWIARFLVAAPVSLAGTRLFREATDPGTSSEVKAFHAAIAALLREPLPLHPDGDCFELDPRPLRMSEEATALWIEFYDEVERQQAEGCELSGVRPWASKAAEHAARIAGVVTLVGDPHATGISADAMAGAIDVAAFYLTEHLRLMGQSLERQALRRLHEMAEWLCSRGPRVRHADVLQRCPRSLRSMKAEGIGNVLAELQSRGYIRRRGDEWEVRP